MSVIDTTKKSEDTLVAEAKFMVWLEGAPPPFAVSHHQQAIDKMANLDIRVAEFAVDYHARELLILKRDCKIHVWIHGRARQLALTARKAHGGILLEKPAAWKMDFGVHPCPLADRSPTNAYMSYECNDCGQDLDLSDALYHYSGMGPLCQECVDSDPDLEGLKWETLA